MSSLSRRIRLLTLGIGVIAVLTLVSATVFSVRLNEATTERDDVTTAVIDVTEARSALEEQMTVARELLAEGDGASTGPFLTGSRPLDREIGRLNASLGETHVADELETFASAVEAWRADVLQAFAEGDPLEGDALEQVVRPPELAEAGEELTAATENLLDSADDDLSSARRIAIVVLIAAGVITLAMLTLVVRSVWIWAVVPARRLSEQAQAVAEGDVNAPIGPEGSTSTEFVQLAESMDTMRHRLLDLAAEARSANVALQQEAPLVAEFRSALQPVDTELPDGVDVAGHVEASEGVLAGDWYDVVAVDETHIGVCVGDVAGHGPTAGLYAVVAKHAVIDGLRSGRDPGKVLRLVADRYGRRTDFVTIWLGILDTESHELSWASAGHPPARILNSGDMESLGPTGPLIGPFAGSWETDSIRLPPGSFLIVCSDGIEEARNRKREYFGEERFLEACTTDSTAGACVESVVDAVRAHLEGLASDDITVVALRCAPRGDET